MAINSNLNKYRKELGLSKITADDLRQYIKDSGKTLNEIEDDFKGKVEIKKEINSLQNSIRQDIKKFNNNIKVNAENEIVLNKFSQTELDKMTSDIIKKDDKIQSLYNDLTDDMKKTTKKELNLFTTSYTPDIAKNIVENIEESYTNKNKDDGLTIFERNLLQRSKGNLSTLTLVDGGRFENTAIYNNLLVSVLNSTVTCVLSDGTKKADFLHNVLKDNVSNSDLISLFLSSIKVGGVYSTWGNSDLKFNVFISMLKKSSRIWYAFQNMLKDEVMDIE